jgi:prefoldin subunit 5
VIERSLKARISNRIASLRNARDFLGQIEELRKANEQLSTTASDFQTAESKVTKIQSLANSQTKLRSFGEPRNSYLLLSIAREQPN